MIINGLQPELIIVSDDVTATTSQEKKLLSATKIDLETAKGSHDIRNTTTRTIVENVIIRSWA